MQKASVLFPRTVKSPIPNYYSPPPPIFCHAKLYCFVMDFNGLAQTFKLWFGVLKFALDF